MVDIFNDKILIAFFLRLEKRYECKSSLLNILRLSNRVIKTNECHNDQKEKCQQFGQANCICKIFKNLQNTIRIADCI